jgi:hypothetical protein
MEQNIEIFDYSQKLETIISKIEQTGIHKYKNKSIQIRELIKKLDAKINSNDLARLLELISKNDEIILENEFKNGVEILLNHGDLRLVYGFIFTYLNKTKTHDETFVMNIILKSFDYHTEIDNCNTLINQTIEKNKSLSNAFWELIMNGYLKTSPTELFLHYLNIYPTVNLFNEKLFRYIVIYHMKSKLISYFFEELKTKFNNSKSESNIKTVYFLESLFDVFLDELANY